MSPKTTSSSLHQTVSRFWEVIPSLWHSIHEHTRQTAAQHFQVSFEQFHMLRGVWRGVDSVSGLADNRHISRAAVSQTVDLLAQKGLLSRHEDPADRRHTCLTLTPQGQALLDQLFQINHDWMADKLAGLTEEEMACLQQAFDILDKTINM